MNRIFQWPCLMILVTCLSLAADAQQPVIKTGMKITKSTRFTKSITFLPAPADTSRSIIIIEGVNIVVDFGGTELRGDRQQTPDTYNGVAVLIRNSRNVTIRNLNARGYKIALTARNTQGLLIENCDFSYNYRQQLGSTAEKEDMSDWMSYHQNEKDEWLRYGAAIYLKDCNAPIVRNCRVTGGQNALMMMRCNNGKIYNNDFSFNSGIGIGLYRSNSNEIAFNRINFNVRGYSHGVYHRGQDSAGILVYEQSSFNIFYKNSATHSGDGFFLWAGQTTMDSGGGGCNYNEIVSNDFSYAPTNGVEVTFSRVRVANNRLFDCDHGIWGGYSYASKFSGNHFRNNRIGIAVEHGQYNEITDNIFVGDREAVKLWSRKTQPSDWGYAKYRDTRSVGYTITGNSFNSNPVVFSLKGTDSLQIANNRYEGFGAIWQVDSTVTNLDSVDVDMADTTLIIPVVPNPIDPFKGNGKLAGKHNIMITEWGPYDFRYPMIWQTNPVEKGDTLRFEILGPKGVWEIKSVRGLEKLSATKGSFPATVTAVRQSSERTDILLELLYRGVAFTNNMGEPIKAGKPYLFQFSKFFQPISWDILYYSMDTAYHNPIRTGMLFSMTERKAPVLTQKKDRLDEAWWGGIRAEGVSYPQFFTVADGTGDFLPGNYELSVTWDDAVRVYVDGKLVLDEWNPSKYSFDESPRRKLQLALGGKHSFRVEHVELGGFACLSLKIKPL